MFPFRRNVRAAAALAGVLMLSAVAAPAHAGGVYFVKQGDTLAAVGRIFGVGAEDIRAANPLVGDRIAPGDRLRIPDAVAPVTAPADPPAAARRDVDPERVRQALCRDETVYHAVAKGETLTAIAKRYHSSVAEIRQLNDLRSRSRLAIGQRLVVRHSGPHTYVVRRGETLTRIAAAQGVRVAELRRLNGLESDALAAGQRLILEPCDRLAAAGSEPPPLGAPAVDDDFRAAVAEAAAQASREAQSLVGAPAAGTSATAPADAAAATDLAQRVIDLAKTMLNIPYRFGGTTLRGIDCSAYVQHVFGLVDLALPRTAREQFGLGARVERAALAVGDLVFFRTYAKFPSHVGIYLGDDLFIHASSVGRRVTIDSLDQGYYRKRFLGGRRVINEDGPALAAAP